MAAALAVWTGKVASCCGGGIFLRDSSMPPGFFGREPLVRSVSLPGRSARRSVASVPSVTAPPFLPFLYPDAREEGGGASSGRQPSSRLLMAPCAQVLTEPDLHGIMLPNPALDGAARTWMLRESTSPGVVSGALGLETPPFCMIPSSGEGKIRSDHEGSSLPRDGRVGPWDQLPDAMAVDEQDGCGGSGADSSKGPVKGPVKGFPVG